MRTRKKFKKKPGQRNFQPQNNRAEPVRRRRRRRYNF